MAAISLCFLKSLKTIYDFLKETHFLCDEYVENMFTKIYQNVLCWSVQVYICFQWGTIWTREYSCFMSVA